MFTRASSHRFFPLISLVMVLSGVLTAQAQTTSAVKLDEFGDMKADDTQARLDLFASALTKDRSLQGFIVAYRQPSWPLGLFRRGVGGYVDYLVNKRGVSSDRLKVVENGLVGKFKCQLWL